MRTLAGLELELGWFEQTPACTELGCHEAIPFDAASFVSLLEQAQAIAEKPWEAMSFLDVGCGVGGKVLLASYLFARAVGIEVDPAYATVARRIERFAPAGRMEIHEGDALSYRDFEAFDIIFIYRPFRDGEQQDRLEERILDFAKPGTILIAPACDYGLGAFDGRIVCLHPDLYLISGTSETTSADLRLE